MPWNAKFAVGLKSFCGSCTLPVGINNALEFDLGHLWLSSDAYHNRPVSNIMPNPLASIQTMRQAKQMPKSEKAPSQPSPTDVEHLGSLLEPSIPLPDVVPTLEVPLANLIVDCLMPARSKDQIPRPADRLIIFMYLNQISVLSRTLPQLIICPMFLY